MDELTISFTDEHVMYAHALLYQAETLEAALYLAESYEFILFQGGDDDGAVFYFKVYAALCLMGELPKGVN
jgi:hypothetical protein